MRHNLIVYIALLLACALLSARAVRVLSLDFDTFTPHLAKHDTFVQFCKPKLKQCVSEAVEFADAAAQLGETPVSMARVDCRREAGMCRMLGITAWPMYVLYAVGQPSRQYLGAKQAPAFAKFAAAAVRSTCSAAPTSSLPKCS